MNRKRTNTRRLSLEPLEDRCLLSAGQLDPTFGSGGIVTTSFPSGVSAARAVAIYANAGTANDGKIVAAGDDGHDFAVARYLPNGSLDNSFGSQGKVTTANTTYAVDVAVQPDGKVVAAGIARANNGDEDFALARYTADGKPDNTFGSKGRVTTNLLKNKGGSSFDRTVAMALQSDGKIVLAGESNLPGGVSNWEAVGLVRYTTDGGLDPTFDGDGKVITTASALPGSFRLWANDMASAPGGKFVVVGPTQSAAQYGAPPWAADLFVARYNTNGNLDSTLDGIGITTLAAGIVVDFQSTVAVQPDGKIIVGWTGAPDGVHIALILARLNTDGSLDATFGTAGKAVVSEIAYVNSLAIQPDGKIVAVGSPTFSFSVARFLANGALDTTFGTGGIFTSPPSFNGGAADMALQPDGKLVLAGTLNPGSTPSFAVVRLLGDGSPLMAASTAPRTVSQTLTLPEVQPILAEAVSRWAATGARTSVLRSVQVVIADLGSTTLGLASGNTIWLDDNAAGWGWFVDPTPGDDSEFTTPGNQGEQHRMDLLTVLEHELGHLLGQDHAEDGVMAETLTAGTRLTPLVNGADWLAAVDMFFAKMRTGERNDLSLA
jgi:uncharacterized delta-60 repeat protein